MLYSCLTVTSCLIVLQNWICRRRDVSISFKIRIIVIPYPYDKTTSIIIMIPITKAIVVYLPALKCFKS